MAKFLKDLELSKLSAEHVTLMDGLILMEEIERAIQTLKTNTMPGLDGYTPEFYKKFRNKFGITFT